MNRPDLADDPRFLRLRPGRPMMRSWRLRSPRNRSARPAADWEARFDAAGVAGVRADGPTPGAFFAHDPQMLVNDFAPECLHARFGTHRRWGPVVRVNGGLDSYRSGVLAGEHTDEILMAMGRSAEEIASLRASRAVASEPLEAPASAAAV